MSEPIDIPGTEYTRSGDDVDWSDVTFTVIWYGPPMSAGAEFGVEWDASGFRRLIIPPRWWQFRKRREYRRVQP